MIISSFWNCLSTVTIKEEHFVAAISRKKTRYGPLISDLEHTDLPVSVVTIEVGSLGHFLPLSISNLWKVCYLQKHCFWAISKQAAQVVMFLQDIRTAELHFFNCVYIYMLWCTFCVSASCIPWVYTPFNARLYFSFFDQVTSLCTVTAVLESSNHFSGNVSYERVQQCRKCFREVTILIHRLDCTTQCLFMLAFSHSHFLFHSWLPKILLTLLVRHTYEKFLATKEGYQTLALE